jgi:PAS domain S-box-containing protein
MTDIDRTLRKIAQTMPQPAWTARPDGSGDFMNNRGLSYAGQTAQQHTDWGWCEKFFPADLEHLMQKVTHSLSSGDEFEAECRIMHAPTENYRWNRVHGVAFRDDAGNIQRWFGTWTDIHDQKIAQEEARAKAEQLELLTKNLPAIIWLADANGKPEFISSYWLKYTGSEWSSAVTMLDKFVHTEDYEKCATIWKDALQNKKKIEIEFRLKRASDYKFVWNVARIEPLLNDDESLMGWIGTIQDVNAHRESESFLQLVIDNIPGIIWWKDINSRYLGCNRKMALMAGANNPKELIGKSDFDLPWAGQALQYRIADKRVIDSNTADYHIVEPIEQHDGKIAWLDTSKVPLRDAEGNVTGTVGNSVDITKIVKLTEQREDFMASLAHDLKVPIVGAIRAFDVLNSGLVGPLTDDQAKFVKKLHQSHEHLLSLIQNLLQVLRYEASADEMQIDHCELSSVFRSCLSDLQSIAKDKKIEIKEEIPEEIMAMADHLAMKRLLMNLVSNAIKFTPNGGRIAVAVKKYETDITISVTDTGAGINKEDQKKLFQRFWQGGGVKKYAAETGLGLYLCRQIAEGHGGQIAVESEAGAGATFLVRFPRKGPSSRVELRLQQ